MTEQEAEAMANRLGRVWAPGVVEHWHLVDGKFRMDLSFQGLSVTHLQNYGSYWIQVLGEEAALRCGEQKGLAGFHYFSIQGDKTVSKDTSAVRAFAALYLPLLRRNCWLSGVNIEASAHEKMEWIQGFTAEELQAWNLKV